MLDHPFASKDWPGLRVSRLSGCLPKLVSSANLALKRGSRGHADHAAALTVRLGQSAMRCRDQDIVRATGNPSTRPRVQAQTTGSSTRRMELAMRPLRDAIIGLAAVGLLAVGCSGNQEPTASAREFVTEAARTSTVDYDPLASPQYALEHSTVAIEGH